ncbi:MAG: NAD-dependent epimerase [Pseudorhodoplanes sp.]
MRFLVTGTAGFIGFHVARNLIREGHQVVGVDGMTSYYDVTLKRARHGHLLQSPDFTAHELMLEDLDGLMRVFEAVRPDIVIHLAAQAGVRYSLENPRAYVDANLIGTFNVLELVRQVPVRHLLFASTSSVYGGNTDMPFREDQRADHPLTLYAASKKAAEAMAHSYSHLWNIPVTACRFFTVYGPWGRPDMALFKFTRAILAGEPIEVYNHGEMDRDFTYVEDLARSIVLLAAQVPSRPDSSAEPEATGATGASDGCSPAAPFRVVNIGNGQPVRLLRFIEEIEQVVGRKAIRKNLPMQLGDVPATWADSDLLSRLTGYKPSTPVSEGISRFVEWYRSYYGV